MVQLLWKSAWWFLKEWKVELPYDPATPLPCTHPRKTKMHFHITACTWMFAVAWPLETWNRQMTSNWQMDKHSMIYSDNGPNSASGIQPWKGMKDWLTHPVDEPWKHLATWMKPGMKDHVPYDSLYRKCADTKSGDRESILAMTS